MSEQQVVERTTTTEYAEDGSVASVTVYEKFAKAPASLWPRWGIYDDWTRPLDYSFQPGRAV